MELYSLMKGLKSNKPHNLPQGNATGKTSKLTIDVQDDEFESYSNRFSKNSPTASKVTTDMQRNSGSIYGPKHRTPSGRSAKRLGATGTISDREQKVFKFPPNSKPQKKIQTGVSNAAISRTESNPKFFGKKTSMTPMQRNSAEENKRRPKTTNSEKKSDTGSSPTLTGMVTQVKKKLLCNRTNQGDDKVYKEHLFQTFQAMKFVQTLQPVNLELLKERRVTVPKRKGFESKKTIVFDLDETLVHCVENISTGKPDIILPVTFPTGEIVKAGIKIRPFVQECLAAANKNFEVFVFTASHPCYANVVLDYLDPKNELIHQRFFRDSCINVNGVYIKDLRIFANRNIKDIVIIDNAAYSFGYQLDNGVPIISWHDDPKDRELFNLMDYFKTLAAVDDVRDVNEQTFHLRTFYEDYVNEFLTGDTVGNSKAGKGKSG